MDFDGRHTAQGGTEIPEDNVVRLPREWLGPPENLVPFGDDEPDDGLGTPPSTHDFWGEALGDDFGVRADAPAAARWDHVRSHRRIARPRPRRVGVPSPSRLSLPSPSRRRRGDTPRRAPASALLGVAVLLAVVAFAVGNGGHATTQDVARAAASVRPGTVATPSPSPLASAGALTSRPSHALRRTAHAVSGRPPRARGRTHATRSRTVRRGAIRRTPRTHALTMEPVRYAAPAVPSPSSASTPSTSSKPAPAPAPVTNAAHSAGPTGSASKQPAFGPNGVLGPGHSPDS